MPNEILNIQHTITQLQNVEKVQAVGVQRNQYQEKQAAEHLQDDRDMEQTIVQISEEAENILLREEGRKDKEKRGNGETGKREEEETGQKVEGGEEAKSVVDIIV